MGTFKSYLPESDPEPELDLHKHPAISSSTVVMHRWGEDMDRFEKYAIQAMPKSWHTILIPRFVDSDTCYAVMFYGALGSEPSDHTKRWSRIGQPFDPSDKHTWHRAPLCTCKGSKRNGDCSLDRDICHQLIDNTLRQVRDETHNTFAYPDYLPMLARNER